MSTKFTKQLRKYSQRAIDLTTQYLNVDEIKFDHVCYQTISKVDYKNAQKELESFMDILREIPHAGRMLTIGKLKKPIDINGFTIDRLELSEPKPKKTVKARNFDHFSFTVGDNLDEIKNRLNTKGVKISEIKQIHNSRLLKFVEGGIEIELRNNRLGDEILESEQSKTISEKQVSPDEDLSQQLEIERQAKLRAIADYQNLQKRINDERARMSVESSVAILGRLLEVIDDFDRAIENLKVEERDQVGLRLVRDKIQQIVDNYGLEEINCSLGDQLNPDIHEAVGIVAVDKKEQNNTIQQILQKGYKLKEGTAVVRSTKVIVGKKNIE